MKYIYAISSGEYLDYSVCCVCESKKEAMKLCARLNSESPSSDKYQVEKFILCNSSIQKSKILSIQIIIWDSGVVDKEIIQVSERWPFDYNGDPGPCNWRWVRAPIYNDKGGRLEVWGTNENRVRKIYGEKKALFMADKSLAAHSEIVGKNQR